MICAHNGCEAEVRPRTSAKGNAPIYCEEHGRPGHRVMRSKAKRRQHYIDKDWDWKQRVRIGAPHVPTRHRSFDTHELAWAAGLFDGEGTIFRGRGGYEKARTGLAQLSVTQSGDPHVLHRFQAAVQVGRVRGPYKGTPRQQMRWLYVANACEDIQHVVCVLWPWLSPVKRAQVHRVLSVHPQDRRRRKPLEQKGMSPRKA